MASEGEPCEPWLGIMAILQNHRGEKELNRVGELNGSVFQKRSQGKFLELSNDT